MPGYKMPFGKFRGIDVSEVPDGALKHYLDWDGLREETRKVLEAEWARRTGGGAHHPGGATVVPDAIKNRAFDLVKAGLAALEREHTDKPAWLDQSRKAAELLRGWLRSANDAAARADDDEVPF